MHKLIGAVGNECRFADATQVRRRDAENRVPPKLTEHPDWHYVWWPLAITAAMAAGGVLFFFDPGQYGFYPQCLFHSLTGLNCPGCGTLRALHHLLHGHFIEAARCNALLVFSMPLLAWPAARWTARYHRGQPGLPALSPWAWIFVFAVVVTFTVLRNVPPLAWPAP